MSRKRAEKDLYQGDSSRRRQTRPTKPVGAVEDGSIEHPCKKRRGPSPDPGAGIENTHKLQTPKVKRTYGRSANRPSNEGKALEEPEQHDQTPATKTPTMAGRRVIFESVEIVSAGKTKNDELPETVSSSDPPDSHPSPTKVPSIAHGQNHRARKEDESVRLTDKRLPKVLPVRLHECLELQKRKILDAFYYPTLIDRQLGDRSKEEAAPSANAIALHQLTDLLGGSLERGEGNSCLLIGPAGSGKSRLFEEALRRHEEEHRPVVIRLNGHVQHTDRLAIREIARQVVEQTGSKTFESLDMNDDDNPFNDGDTVPLIGSLPPPSHLPSLIAALPTLPRPVVVLLDAFNIFIEQPRQALLYCLLDTVQSCRMGSSAHRGLAVVGITSRIDVVNFLEKRVKSRFSHRIFRTASSCRFEEWMALLRSCLCQGLGALESTNISDWRSIWEPSVNEFLQDRSVKETFRDMFGISRDVRRLLKIMTSVILRLDPSSPYLTPQSLRQCLKLQSNTPHAASSLMRLNYPTLSLCIAAQHARTAGHDTFTFEMLYDKFAIQVRTSSAAPVMLGGGSIGMVNIGRTVMIGAFEELVQMKIFVQVAHSAAGLGKEFIKYRCAVGRDDVKTVVDRIGQTSLKKWFSKAQW